MIPLLPPDFQILAQHNGKRLRYSLRTTPQKLPDGVSIEIVVVISALLFIPQPHPNAPRELPAAAAEASPTAASPQGYLG